MPAPATDTLIHYHPDATSGGRAVCMARDGAVTAQFGLVTCFACRSTTAFKSDQYRAENPVTIGQILGAADLDVAVLAERAEAEAATAPKRNERGMYVIEEVIHHGDYRSARRVEVYSVNVVTVDAVLQSSAYAYGSWQHPENPDHTEVRRLQLRQLVSDLKHGLTNRSIGWSTFRLI